MIRSLAIAGIAGGLLRIANAFTGGVLDPQLLQISYALTDMLMLAGIAAVLLGYGGGLSVLGFAGASIAALGLIFIRATAFTAPEAYVIGAGIAVAGTALLGADLLWRRIGGVITPLLWILAFALAVGGTLANLASLQMLAGIAFGAGFVGSGVLLAAQKERAVSG